MMSEGFQLVDILFFAAVAGFILLRLRGVLGRRTGHQPPPNPHRGADEAGDTVARLAERETAEEFSAARDGEISEADDDPDDGGQALAAGLSRIKDRDEGFTRKGFLEGSLAAFEIIIEAFADGDTERLRDLLDDTVYRPFSRVIEDRREAGHRHQTTLVSIEKNDIIEAGMNGRIAFVVVCFVSRQINVTRDAADTVVGGDSANAVTVTDIWTFERDTRSHSPNWKLVATRSPN